MYFSSRITPSNISSTISAIEIDLRDLIVAYLELGVVQKIEGWERRVDDLLEWFNDNVQSKDELEKKWDIRSRLDGIIIRLVSRRNFGFILSSDKQEFFFHRYMMAKPSDWGKLQEGTPVFFCDGGSMGGRLPNAENVTLRNTTSPNSENYLKGE